MLQHFQRILRQYPLILAFLVGIVIMNIWSIHQKVDAAQETVETVTTIPTETSTEITTTQPITEPAETYQLVDSSYFDDALFIGDSRSEGLALYGSLTNADYFTNVGMSIYEVDEIEAGNPNKNESVTLSEKLAQRQYGKIYVMLGLNELGTGTTDTWAETYESVINKIQAAQPNAIIYIQSIMPVSAAKDDPYGAINNKNIETRNQALESLENPNEQIYYINVSEAVSDENGYLKADYTSDGIHLLGDSLSIWEDYLQRHAVLSERETKTIPTPQQSSTEASFEDLPEAGTTGQS